MTAHDDLIRRFPKGRRLVVAVDGPAGAGKGAVCRAVAGRFGLSYLETGALYRAVGLIARRERSETADALAEYARTMPFAFRMAADGGFRAWLGEEEVTAALRDEQVGQAASRVAAIPEVRAALLGFQRGYGGDADIILDGRDVGTQVWPDADLKIFLTATLDERAKRRALELQQRGEAVRFPEIRDAMARRDALDAGRSHAPLAAAEDAVVVDTTRLTLEQSIGAVADLLDRHRSGPAT